MKKKLVFIIIYIIFFFNSNLLSQNDNRILKVGLLAPLTGNYSELGNSFLYSLQLALEEINDKDVFIVPRDSGFNDKDKLNKAIQDLRDQDMALDSMILSNYLDSYAETGEKYVEVLQKIIKQNNLKDFDDAKLLPSSIELESLI